MDGAEDDFSSLSVDERLQHKNWKARVSAYEDLTKSFRTSVAEDAPEFNRDPGLLAKAILDANVVAQEKGIETACAYIEFGGRPAAIRARDQFVAALRDKGLWGATRAGTKKAAVELCLLIVECEGSADALLEAGVIEGLKSKQPKAVAGAVTVLKELVKQFGVKIVNPKPILKTIPTIFAHADKGVRAEGTLLVQELHRWIGAAIDPHLSELKPVQIKELNDSFAGEEKPSQTRLTRAQQRERALKEAEASLEGTSKQNGEEEAAETQGDAPDEEAEPMDFSDPVSILDKLPPDFYDMLASSKWKERKELALEPLLETLKKSPKIVDANYEELVRALAGRMSDANIVCVIAAANCIECMAKGLKTAFSRYKPMTVPPILERCKEKKQSVTDALAAALDAAAASVSISDIVEDVTTFAKHKNPQVKEQTYRWLIRCLRITRVSPNLKTDLKPLSDCLVSGFEDSFEPVRTAAAEGLGTLMKIMGERPMMATMEQLDDIRKTKVKEFAEKAEVKCKAGAGAPAAPPKTTVPSKAPIKIAPTNKAPVPRAVISPTADKENAPPVSAPKLASSPSPTPKPTKGLPARLMGKQPLANAAPTVKKVAPINAPAMSKAPSASKSALNEPLKYKMSQEDAEAQAESVLPSSIYSELANSNWKLRLAAMEELQAWIEGDGNTTESELVVRVLSKKPGWKESNFQVYGKMTSIFQHLANQSASWSRACSALTIGPMSDKLGDIKLKKPVGEALTAYAEKFSLQFVLSQAYDPMTKQKAPKAQADALLWVEQSLRDFGIQGISVRDLIEFLKNGLKSSNAAVRTSATKTLVTLKLYVGADIKTFLQDLNSTLLTTIDTEFEKVNGESPPEPTRQSGDNAASAAQSNGAANGKASKGGQDALDDLFPRQDIDKLIPHGLVTGLNDANWKARKEALEQIQGILEANKRLKPNLGEIGPALKMRLADSNKMVQGLALDVIARIATGMDKGFEKHARMFLAGMVAILADAKANVRAPAISTLTAIYDACGLDCMLSGLATGLETTNPMQRKELATWLEVQLERSSARVDLSLIVGPTVACLEDRTAEVRKAAQSLLPYIAASCGYQALLDRANALKPASRSAVLPLLESAKSAVPNSTTHVKEPSVPSDLPKPSRPASAASGGLSDTTATKASGRAPTAINRPLKAPASLAQSSSRSATPTELNPASASASLHKALPPRKALAAKASAASPPFSVALTNGNDGVSEPPLRASDPSAKQNRGARETGPLRWSIETSARPDQVEYLHHQMAPHASSQLMSTLFSKGQHCERDFLGGLSTLADATSQETATASSLDVDELKRSMVTNADLVLKYLTIRLSDSATVIVLKCFDVYETIVTAMLDLGNHLSDYEAGAFLPSLIAKLGDGKETIRVRVKALLKSTGSIYPSSKIFTALLDHGTKAKNARTRSESTEELGGLLLRQGQSVCQPTKALPVIAALISDKDPSCRSAALSALANAYTLLGDAVYRLVGDLQDKERSMLEEKLKRTHTGVASPARFGTAGASSGTPSRPDSRQGGALRPDSRVGTGKPSGISRLPAAAGVKRRISSIPVADPATHQASRDSHLPQPRAFHQAKAPSQSPEEPLRTLATRQRMVSDEAEPVFDSVNGSPELQAGQHGSILVDNPNQAVEALKQVQNDIASEPDRIAASSDVLIRVICQSSAKAFHDLHADTPQTVLRLCKHLMQTLSNFFDQKLLSVTVSREVLVLLLEELTRRLLETSNNAASDAITSLSKVLNMILIRIFHNTERSACFGALFTLLQTSSQNLRELKGDKLSEQSKYAELVMKCLWKVSKTAKECLENKTLDARHLLFDIDQFLQTIPPAEWRRRAADGVPLGDMPLRTVKTVLQQVVATFGEAVYEELTLIDRPENSFVYQYLFRLLNNARSVNVPASNSPSRQISQNTSPPHHNGHSQGGSVSSPSTTVTRMDDTRLNNALKDIFDKIGNAQKSKEGIAELYQFQKEHPEAEARINTWITATGSFFQSYLKRALSNLAADENERATPASPRSSLSPTLSPPPSRPTSSFSPQSVSTNSPRHSVAHDERLDSLKRMFS